MKNEKPSRRIFHFSFFILRLELRTVDATALRAANEIDDGKFETAISTAFLAEA